MRGIEFAGSGDAHCEISIIGLPWDGGASLGAPGARYGPAAVRSALGWWLDRIRDDQVWDVEAGEVVDLSGLRLRDRGDVAVAYDAETTFERATELVGEALDAGEVPILIGGDHSISIPAVRALASRRERIGVIQLDAHLDLVDESPEQGRLSQSSPMRRAIEHPASHPGRLVQIGLRSFNYPEYLAWCRERGIVQITTRDALELGPGAVADRAVRASADGGADVYLTLDLDCLDPSAAPGVGHLEPGGLPVTFVSQVVRRLAPRVAAFDIAELNPMCDVHGMTASVAAKLLLDFVFGRAAAMRPVQDVPPARPARVRPPA